MENLEFREKKEILSGVSSVETLDSTEVEKLRNEVSELKKEAEEKIKIAKKEGRELDYCQNIELIDINPEKLVEKDFLLFKKLKEDTLTFKDISEYRVREITPFIVEKLSRAEEEGWGQDVAGDDFQYHDIVMKDSRAAFLGWIGAFWTAREAKRILEEKHNKKKNLS